MDVDLDAPMDAPGVGVHVLIIALGTVMGVLVVVEHVQAAVAVAAMVALDVEARAHMIVGDVPDAQVDATTPAKGHVMADAPAAPGAVAHVRHVVLIDVLRTRRSPVL